MTYSTPMILGEVGWVSQVPQGGIPSEGPQFQCYIWDPVWSCAETHPQEHFMGLGQIWGAAQNSEQDETSVWALCPVFQSDVAEVMLFIFHHGVLVRFGVTNGPTCRSTTLVWRCWMTANTAILSTRTPWPCHCTGPISSIVNQNYNSRPLNISKSSRDCNRRYVCLRLRAPKAPDANADMGTHHFIYAVMPHSGGFS